MFLQVTDEWTEFLGGIPVDSSRPLKLQTYFPLRSTVLISDTSYSELK